MSTDPIADLRYACERIKNSTGGRQPNVMPIMSASIIERMIANLRDQIALAERLLGIGCDPEGKFPTGWPWTKRAGRPSKEEKRLRDCLPGWRSLLKGLEEPERVSDDRRIHIMSASEVESRIATLLAGDRRGGKTGMINEAREEFSKAISGTALTAADGPGYNMPRIYEDIRYPAQAMAVIHRHPDGQEMTRMAHSAVLTNPDVPLGHAMPTANINGWMATANPRPTGKRAQRARSKPWRR